MTITTLPTRQREALFLAHHGPLGMVRGFKPQAKALVKKGLLDDDLRPTEAGVELYHELTDPVTWAQFVSHPDVRLHLLEEQRRRSAGVHYTTGPGSYIVHPSEDGFTTYFAERGGKAARTWAVVTSTIPEDRRRGWGLPTIGIVR